MGTATAQGQLWGRHANTWSKPMEQAMRPQYAAVEPLAGSTLLDVGCGAGQALTDAAARGAVVVGLDASAALLAVAAARVPAATLQIAEGIGLWSLQRWGEYVAVVGTTIFIPLEVYELIENISWPKIVVLLVNVATVLYLLLSKRLFGLRGGHRAYEASLHEVSLLEVETSARTA